MSYRAIELLSNKNNLYEILEMLMTYRMDYEAFQISTENYTPNLPINTENINPFQKEDDMEMISAKQAYDASTICKGNKVKQELETIRKRILQEIEKGQTSFYLYNKSLLAGTRNKLEELGYIVLTSFAKNETDTKISWEHYEKEAE